MSIQLRDGLLNQSVDLVLEDLLVRFLVNVPNEDLSSIERVFFQVEEAQWFYTDFVKQLNPYLPGMKMKSFAPKFLEKCPLIWKWGNPSDAIQRFGKYKSIIPVRGVALFNKDLSKVVLVQGTESNTWSFPRGKISKDESDIDCAAREVLEETGFDAKGLINENDVIERTIKGKNYKIYLVKNVSEDYNFQPVARNEISKIEWFDIKALQKKSRSNPNHFFIVGTVLKPMLKWINKNKGGINEEEIMWDVEVKLKKLLGITGGANENVDAGRELLDILQQVTTTNNGPAPMQNYNVPQNLLHFPGIYNPIPNPHGPLYPPQPFHPHFQATPVPPTQNLAYQPSPDQYVDHSHQQPNPATFAKPANRGPTDSKELLSILNKPKQKPEEEKPIQKQDGQESNRARAQHLLSLIDGKESISSENATQTILSILNKKKDTPTSENASQTLMNILNQKDKTPKSPKSLQQGSQSLMDLLKPKKDNPKTEINGSESHELLNILNKNVSPAAVYQTSHEPSNELEESMRNERHGFGGISEAGKKPTLLRRTDPSKNNDSSQDPTNKSSHASSKELLSLLKRPQSAKQVPETQAESAPQETPSRPEVQTSASQELLGLLNKKSTPPAKDLVLEHTTAKPEGEAFEEFENFEDFEDFNGLSEQIMGKSSYRNFDIASDEEDVDHLIDEFSSPFVPQSAELPGSNYARPTDLFNQPEPKKNKIRLLKPGEPLNDIFSAPEQTASASEASQSNSHGQSLLALLNGKKPDNNQEHKPVNDSFQNIYGADPDSGAQSSPISLNNVAAHSSHSAEVLKDLLWKRN